MEAQEVPTDDICQSVGFLMASQKLENTILYF